MEFLLSSSISVFSIIYFLLYFRNNHEYPKGTDIKIIAIKEGNPISHIVTNVSLVSYTKNQIVVTHSNHGREIKSVFERKYVVSVGVLS